MKLIIDISDKEYPMLKEIKENRYRDLDHLEKAVLNGIPLPKGHGFKITKDGEIIEEE